MPKPDRAPDNPTGADFDKLEDDRKRYTTATNVGRHRAGATVGRKDLGPGAQVQRLLDAGAIVPAPDAEEGEAAPAADAGRTDPALNIGKGPGAEGRDVRPGSDPESGLAAELGNAYETTQPTDPNQAKDEGDGGSMFGTKKKK